MSYLMDENGNVYFNAYESPSQAFTPEEWIVEKERLIVGLNIQIASFQNQIDNQPQPVEILESFPDDVKAALQEYNEMLGEYDIEGLEIQIIEKQALLAEIEVL